MQIEGGCYCGAVRYRAEGDPGFNAQCHCRECQYISGGNPNVIIAMPTAGFIYTKGAPKEFSRRDIANPVTRQFCGECGTHMVTLAPALKAMVMIKIGTLDDPSIVGQPQMAIFTVDKQSFHHIPTGIPAFERVPG